MKTSTFLTLSTLLLAIASAASAAEPMSFQYADGRPAEVAIGRYPAGPQLPHRTAVSYPGRRHSARLAPLDDVAYVYASFKACQANPAPYVDGAPAAYQTVSLGYDAGGKFTPLLRFGMVDDDRASGKQMANYTPGVFDGRIDYYGMFARPGTAYDFKLKVDLKVKRATVWVAGRGDDAWFPLTVDVPLNQDAANGCRINALRVDQLSGAPSIEGVVVSPTPWPEGESLRPHPAAKADRIVKPNSEFTFQSMRSLWRAADRHVTVARHPNRAQGWWLGFPDVVQTGPTSLVCVHNDGAAHGGGGRMWVCHSSDLGKSWNHPIVVHPGPLNCPRIQKLRDGSLLALTDTRTGPEYPLVFYRSTDGGHAWTHVGTLQPKLAGGRETCVPSRVTELPDGSWLVCGCYTPGKAWHVTEGETVEFYRSADQGKTWKLYSQLKPPAPLSICEPSIVPLPDGRWLLFARESGGFLPGARFYSTDQGKTWSPPEELPFFIQGRTCAGLLADGRAMVTFRSNAGPPALWAWIGDPDEKTQPVVRGIHFNDRTSVGLGDGAFHIDNDGRLGQFTKYVFRVPDSDQSRIEVTAELKVLSNHGRAATLSVPFVGKLRFFPDHVELAHAPQVRVDVTPGEFHTYHLVREPGRMTLSVDGKETLTTDKIEEHLCKLAWSALKLSPYLMAFGNEEAPDKQSVFDWVDEDERKRAGPPESLTAAPDVILPKMITPGVTGYSIWRSLEIRYDDPKTGEHRVSWKAKRDRFPDQYQLDRLIEIDATVSGCDQGYSGWCQFQDGRIFVVNYTDDTARWNRKAGSPTLGVSWIRGTFVEPSDLPPSE